MADPDRVEDRTFRVSFSADGAAKLRECVRGKLKEFMGDYTDDTLVEYVVVLLRNGRRKDEAKNELNVFLGDDTDSFVSWLWSHLSSSLDLYVQHTEPYLEEATNRNGLVERQATQNDSYQGDSNFEREKILKESKSRRNREWKGLVRDVAEPPPLRSSEVENFYFEEKIRQKTSSVKRSHSPQSPTRKKRSYQDDKQLRKQRELASHPIVSAPRRLLQFAVRDAVGTLRPSSSRMEPALKRLRSVVSTATEYPSHNDQYHGMRSSGRLPSAVAIAVRAAAEAAEDVSKNRSSGNAFDRLGHPTDASEMTNQSLGFQTNDVEIGEVEEYDQMAGESCNFVPRNEYGTGRQLSGKIPMADENDFKSYDYGSDNDGYDNNVINHRGVDNSLADPSRGNKDEDTLMVQYSVAHNTDELVKRARVKDQKSPPANGNRKIVNISVNVNTWKPPVHYQGSEHIREKENMIVNKGKEAAASKPLNLVKESNHMVLPTKESEKLSMIVQKEPSKTASSVAVTGSVFTSRPLEDTDSRTIFVSNVHFAATKDTLSRHVNKFGDVLKVTIVTDAATGQPKGSAYVEFTHKEAAEHALSLDGTSFMSRILKVVKKSAAYQEASNMVCWPRLARASPYTGRFVRGNFLRSFPGAFRSRQPIKAGARSLQWKRDAQTAPTTENTVNFQLGAVGASSTSIVPSTAARSLTYVRKESKPDGDAGGMKV